MPEQTRTRRGSVLLAPRWLIAGYFVVLAAVVASVMPTLLATNHALDVQQQALDPTSTAARQLLNGALNQETGVRGYVLTGQADFLQPFRDGSSTYDSAIRYLRHVSPSEPGLAPRVQSTDAAFQRWRTLADGLIGLVSASNLPVARQLATAEVGKTQFDTFRAQQAALLAVTERATSDNRQHLKAEILASIVLFLIVVSIGLGLAAAMWSWWRWWGKRSAAVERQLVDTGILVQSVINATNEPIFAKDREGRHILANRARAASLANGDADADILGRGAEEFVKPDLAAVIRRDEQKLMAEGGETRLLEELGQPDGVHVFDTVKSPLYAVDGSVIGVVGVARDITEEQKLLFDRERLYQMEHRLATIMQRTMLGTNEFSDGRVEVRARYQPAVDELMVGGDWYDVVALHNGNVAVIVGDVVGKGLEAATVMGQMRSALAALTSSYLEPAATLDALDRFAGGIPGARCTTCALAIIDPLEERLVYASAGHVPLLVLDGAGKPEYLEERHDPPIAAFDRQIDRKSASTRFEKGSTLVLYTDGLIERRTEALDVGLSRLATTAGDHHDLDVDELSEVILSKLLVDGSQADDAVLVCARLVASTLEGGTNDQFLRTIPAEVLAIRICRHELADWLRRVDLGEQRRQGLVVAAGEAITNCVEHAYVDGHTDRPTIVVRATCEGDAVTVTVLDHGSWLGSRPDSHRGRGIPLMRELADSVDIRIGPNGTLVEFEMAIRPDEPLSQSDEAFGPR